MKHKLSEINEEERTGLCSVCGPIRVKLRDKTRPLSSKYRCIQVYKIKEKRRRSPYHLYRKNYCEHCNFKPMHISQLDVDHIDGDHFNNDPANLQTLCANCHRLKTHLSGDSNSGIN